MHKNIGEKFGIKYESRKKMKNPYHGITWFDPESEETEEDFDFLLKMWRDTGKCDNGMHLLDEVFNSEGEHYLVCDACELVINIASIDTQYVKD